LHWESVGEYLERLDNGAATKRIVYLADQLGIDLPARDELVASFTSGYSLLDPTQPETGSTDSTYRLRINVKPAQLEPTEFSVEMRAGLTSRITRIIVSKRYRKRFGCATVVEQLRS
jgi:hypothetical protein